MTSPTRFWSDLTTADVASLDLARTIAVLPVAAIEQHGPHLPLSVDTDIANGVVAASLPHIAPDLPALFLPTQAVGYSPEHTRFAGTLTLKAETVLRVWTEIGECVAASGVKNAGALQCARRAGGFAGRGGARPARAPGVCWSTA